MEEGIGAPRTPGLRQLRGLPSCPDTQRTLKHQVIRWVGVTVPEHADGQVVGGPGADPRQCQQSPSCRSPVGAGVQCQTVRGGPGQRGYRARSGMGNPGCSLDFCGGNTGQGLRRGEGGESGRPGATERGNQARTEGPGRSEGHLLAQDGQDGGLKTVGAAGNPQPGMAPHQGFQELKAGKERIGHIVVRVQIQSGPDLGGQRGILRVRQVRPGQQHPRPG